MMTRRKALTTMAAGAALAQTGQAGSAAPALRISIFSKHLQWADWHSMADIAARIGFDGVDLTVRNGGHVLPERVQADLPEAVKIIHAAGLTTPMITAGIVDVDSPHAEAILGTAASLGIRRYRWGGFKYDYSRNLLKQLDELKPRVNRLAELNQKHQIAAMYHTHSGRGEVGAPIWDIWTVLRDTDPRWLGINYDIGHATVEGGLGGWMDSARLLQERMLGVALKDFLWIKDPHNRWTPGWCPTGEGMVDFGTFFEILKTERFDGPLQLHFEYPAMGGAENGDRKLTTPKERVTAAMQRDLKYIRAQMKVAGLA